MVTLADLQRVSHQREPSERTGSEPDWRARLVAAVTGSGRAGLSPIVEAMTGSGASLNASGIQAVRQAVAPLFGVADPWRQFQADLTPFTGLTTQFIETMFGFRRVADLLADIARRRRDAETTVARIAAGDRTAVQPYLAAARRLWQERRLVLFETEAPNGSVAAVVQHQATWQAVDQALAAEAARQGKSKQFVLNNLLAAEMLALCTEWTGSDDEPDAIGLLRLMPDVAAEAVARDFVSRPHDGSLIVECRPVRPVAVPRRGRPRKYDPESCRLMLAAIIQHARYPHRLTLDDAADILDTLCREPQPVSVNATPVFFPAPYTTPYDITIPDRVRKQRRDRLDHIRQAAGFASWQHALDHFLNRNS